MIYTKEKIKVFISSACGEGYENYNIARAALKALIESTGIATVYLFEGEGASIISAGEHYSSALEECDVCIFLIDNKDGIRPGVQIEIDCVNKYKIKALYYFCDKDSTEKTPLQESIMGYNFAKSRVIHSFEEFITSGAQDLISDLIGIYKKYCKGRLENVEKIEETIESSISLSFGLEATIATKNTIANIDKCKVYFLKMLQGYGKEIENTNSLDGWYCKFLTILFENKSIQEFNTGLFLKDLEVYQDTEYHSLVKKRWEAIQAYFQGNLEECIRLLEQALDMAKNQLFPDWIIKDILIDLRNQNIFLSQFQNEYFVYKHQDEINNSEHALYYPLLDRFDKELNEMYIADSLNEKIKSPYTYSFGKNLSYYTDLISNIYVISMFNGSLTHIMKIYDRIKFLTFHLCQQYSNWEIRVLLLKTTLINCNTKEIDGIIYEAEDILGKMNAKDALDIFNFTNNHPIEYQRQISNLEALKSVGYFLADKDFDNIIDQVSEFINDWLEDDKACILLGGHIISALDGVARRIDPNRLVDICCKFLERGRVRWEDGLFKLIGQHIKLSQLNHIVCERLIEQIRMVVEDEEKRNHSNNLGYLLQCLRKQDKILTQELDETIRKEMPKFYEEDYKLETSEDDKEMPLFISKYIDKINKRNMKQGENGTYSGYGDRAHIIIKSIITNSDNIYSEELLNATFSAASNTLLSKRQTIEEKCDAIELLIFLCKRFPQLMIHNEVIIEKLKDNKEITEDGKVLMSNLSIIALKFSILFLYNCFGEDIYQPMMEMLPFLVDDIPTQLQVSKIILTFLEADEEEIPQNVEILLLQQVLTWCKSNQVDLRWKAIRILFQLLRNNNNQSIISNQLIQLMDSDNVYIKNGIIRLTAKNHKMAKSIADYLLQKAAVDPNYMVRKVCEEILSQQ
ncbi:hypothetical protein PBV87_13245 [Niameybacter massiliensis]|uniref:Uncharacterized protein n=1 Tax=Holtiella tumoricola TaxID=3018743 RepID=A0AA42J1E4_9FIRM|nr:hypothetical protein [Holtiella tumoricola]MDA3732452.1 hypothetical protein [Holtiella tumoricola]